MENKPSPARLTRLVGRALDVIQRGPIWAAQCLSCEHGSIGKRIWKCRAYRKPDHSPEYCANIRSGKGDCPKFISKGAGVVPPNAKLTRPANESEPATGGDGLGSGALLDASTFTGVRPASNSTVQRPNAAPTGIDGSALTNTDDKETT